MINTQQQISSFSAGISVKISEQPWFWHLSNQPSTDPTHRPLHISPIPDASVEPSNILVRTARPHLHQLNRAIRFHVFRPKLHPITLAGGASRISNQNSVRITQPGSTQKNPTNHPSIFPSQGPFQISTQTSVHIAQLGSISKNPREPPYTVPSKDPISAQANFHQKTLATR